MASEEGDENLSTFPVSMSSSFEETSDPDSPAGGQLCVHVSFNREHISHMNPYC